MQGPMVGQGNGRMTQFGVEEKKKILWLVVPGDAKMREGDSETETPYRRAALDLSGPGELARQVAGTE